MKKTQSLYFEFVLEISALRGRGQSILSISCFLTQWNGLVFPWEFLALFLPLVGSAFGIRLKGTMCRFVRLFSKRGHQPADSAPPEEGLTEMVYLGTNPRSADLASALEQDPQKIPCTLRPEKYWPKRSPREDAWFSLELLGSYRQVVPRVAIIQPVKVMELSSHSSSPYLLLPISICSIGKSECFYISLFSSCLTYELTKYEEV